MAINLRTNEDLIRGTEALFAPTASFGKLCVVDRDEIEGYRSIHNLFRSYLNDKSNKRPLSIAVFGPPGSGKSFGVKEVAKSLRKGTSNTGSVDFNVAQFSDPSELGSAFLQIRDVGTDSILPLAFDEFDSSLEGKELGWLRYFLAPMQDGEFFYDDKRLHLGRAILVFAGGTTPNLKSFAREERDSEKDDRARFVQAKGPDFVSRLGGSINILGVNQREDVPSDQAYILRRAVIMRRMLEERNLTGRGNRSVVDATLVSKLLKIGRYKHGSRSLVMILKMCVGDGGIIRLPPSDQLVIHLDKDDADMLLSYGV